MALQIDSVTELSHPRNVAGCCDGHGQVFHNASGDPDGPGALTYVTLCPNGCGGRAWEADIARAEADHAARVAEHGGDELYWVDQIVRRGRA